MPTFCENQWFITMFTRNPPLVLAMSHINPVHTDPSHFFRIQFKEPLSFIFLHKSPACISLFPHSGHMPSQPGASFTTQVMFSKKYKSRSFLLCSFLPSFITSSLLGWNVFLNSLFSNTLSCVLLFMWQTKIHTCIKQQATVIGLYILIFLVLDSKLESRTFCTESQHEFPEFNLPLLVQFVMQHWLVVGYQLPTNAV